MAEESRRQQAAARAQESFLKKQIAAEEAGAPAAEQVKRSEFTSGVPKPAETPGGAPTAAVVAPAAASHCLLHY